MQEVDVSGVTGTFKLHFGSSDTSAIAKGATAATVETALQALAGLTNVFVTKQGDVYRITFVTPSGNVAQLTSPTAGVTVATLSDGGAAPVEVGIVSGLGMKLWERDAGGTTVETTGRVEFEGFESIDVRLGNGGDTFTVGGDLLDALPPTRRDVVTQFVHTTAAMTTISTGGGGDTIRLFATATLNRSVVDRALDLVHTATTSDGTSSLDEVQTIEISSVAQTQGSGYYTLRYRYQETKPIPFGSDAGAIQDALRALLLLQAQTPIVSVTGGPNSFTVTFDHALGNVEQLVAQIVPLLLDGSDGNDTVRVQSIFEDTFIKGGDEVGSSGFQTNGDTMELNVNIGTLLPLGTDEISANDPDDSPITTIGNGGIAAFTTVTNGDGTTDEVQQLTISGAGSFALGFGGAVDTIAPTVTAASLQSKLEGLSTIGVGKVSVADGAVAGTFTITFQNALGHRDVEELTAGEVQRFPLEDVTGGTFTITLDLNHDGIPDPGMTTGPITWDGPASAVDKALEALDGDLAIDDNDFGVARVGNVYTIFYQGDVQGTDHGPLILGKSQLRSNGINAFVTLDGEGGNDTYKVNLIGGTTNSLLNVFDSGTAGLDSSRPPATADTDSLIVYGTSNVFKPDVFLLRAATAETGLAFIALINAPDPHNVHPADPVERVNYNTSLESITVEGREGDDEFWVDDTRAPITINAGAGNDFFQVGQLYQSRRTPELANVLAQDVFATIETTKGWLSNGISNPMTINGGSGEDLFIVFHNLAVLTLNGGDDNDTFLIQAFALAGSQEDTRELTDLSGDAGADLIQYAVNAPVNINGGDGFDTVIVIGTEFGDDFVITKFGVFGAGLNVNFINIESLEVDGAEGDDRFFVLSTGVNFQTTITGGLGTDLFSVEGPTPANGVISNDLLGHSGIITHGVESNVPASQWAGLKVIGISANVADNDEPGVVITASGGHSLVVECGSSAAAYMDTANGCSDTYTVTLTRPPVGTGASAETVTVQVLAPPGLVFLDSSFNPIRAVSDEVDVVRVINADDGKYKLCFDVNKDGCDASEKTALIEFAATAAEVQSALEGLGSIDPGDIAVTQEGTTYTIEFKETGPNNLVLGNHDLGDLSAVDSTLTALAGTASVRVQEAVKGGQSVAAGLNLCFESASATGSNNCVSDEIQKVKIAGATGGTFTLTFGLNTTGALAYNASAAVVQAALTGLASIGANNVHVTKSVSTYAVEFIGNKLDQNVAELIANGASLTGGAASATVTTLIQGGVQLGGKWWKPQTVRFGVDTQVPEIPDIGDIQHRVIVSDKPAGTIRGVVTFAVSTETDPLVTGDEYATISSSLTTFPTPSAALPEGLRGEYLKITGGDDEAAGQIRLILGSHRAHITTPGGGFSFSYDKNGDGSIGPGESTVTVLSGDVAASLLTTALEELFGHLNVSVTRTSANNYDLELKGDLVFSNFAPLLGNSGATVAVDAHSLKLNKPWSVEPNFGGANAALFEITQFSAVQMPNVRVRIYAAVRPEVVVDESEGSTSVAEAGGTADVDTINVRLSKAPIAGETIHVALDGSGQLAFWRGGFAITEVTFTSADWNAYKAVEVRAVDDTVVEGFHNADLRLSATSTGVGTPTFYGSFLTVADIADNDYVGVRVLESNGSTNVIEFDPVNHGVSDVTATVDGFPKADDYRILLTKSPGAETLTITVRAEPTRTSRTGGIRAFTEQLKVCVVTAGEPCTDDTHFALSKTVKFIDDTITVDPTAVNWDTPVVVRVRAIDDKRVDGQDTQVFAQTLDYLNQIQGPLFIRGGAGDDRTGLFEREPVMLPRGGGHDASKPELNQRPSMGSVVVSTDTPPDPAATVTIDASPLRGIGTCANETPAFDPGCVDGDSTHNEVQYLDVRATGGTFTLTFGGQTTDPIAFNASALQLELALEALGGIDDVKVSKNSNVFKIEFKGAQANTDVATLVAGISGLKPVTPADLIDFSITITRGPAKNKVRIITGAQDLGGNQWKLTLSKSWVSSFTHDASKPNSTSGYTLDVTNPNLLVKEETQADILWVNDTDNPACFDHPDCANGAGSNPGAIGKIFLDDTKFGSKVNVSTKTNGGAGGASEVQRLAVVNATEGTYKLLFNGVPTSDIAWNADAAAIQTALWTIPALNGKVTVGIDPENPSAFLVTFIGTLAASDQPLLRVDARGLPFGTAGTALNQFRITGFGMPDTRVIGGELLDARQPGGITFSAIEDLDINLGSGNTKFTVENTPAGTLTRINSGAGDDLVFVKKLQGHTFVNLGAGTDTINVANDQQKLSDLLGLLTVSGDQPRADVVTLAKGSPQEGTSVAPVNEIQQLTIDATGGTFTLTYIPAIVTTVTPGRVSPATNEVQTLQVNAVGGTYTLSLDVNGNGIIDAAGETTVPIAFDAPATGVGSVQAALAALVGGVGNVAVTGTGGLYTITFQGTKAHTDMPQLVPNGVTTAPIAYNAAGTGAGSVQQALTNLAQIGAAANADVLKTGGIYKLTFKGGLGARDIELISANPAGLTNGLGASDTLNLNDSAYTLDGVAALTSSSLTGLSMPTQNEIQELVIDATGGTFTLAGSSTALAYNVSAADLQAAVEALPGVGVGNVIVTKNDDIYVLRFQGDLTNTNVPQIALGTNLLTKTIELLGGGTSTGLPGSGSVVISTRVQGGAGIPLNDMIALTVRATGGTFTLSYDLNHDGLIGPGETTAPLPFDATAEVVRKALQKVVAQGDIFQELKFDFTVDRYVTYDAAGPPAPAGVALVYLIGLQGNLRQVPQSGSDAPPGADILFANVGSLTGTAQVGTRMDGVNYYGVETLTIDAGSGTEILSVQGTTAGSRGFELGIDGIEGTPDDGHAATNVNLHVGDEKAFVSSNADLDHASWSGFDFLTGTLDDLRGALNIDFGTGRHRLFVSDEGSPNGDGTVAAPVRITDTAPGALNGLAASADIWVTGLGEPGGISYKTDLVTGNLYDGVVYWSGSGNDRIVVDGTQNRPGQDQRTTTVLNTGLGDDNVTVNLTNGLDGFFVVEASGGRATNDPVAHSLPPGATDDDTVDGSGSSLPLVLIGGFGTDTLKGGSGYDLILGDLGIVQYVSSIASNTPIAQFGFGGRGDLISSQIVDPRWAYSRDLTVGGADTIYGNNGEDVLIGGAAGDRIDGGAQDDLIFGDAVRLQRRDINVSVIGGVAGSITNPRFQALIGTQIYPFDTVAADAASFTEATIALNDGTPQNYRDAVGSYTPAPTWAEYVITNLYHTLALQNAPDNSWGGDTIAGGPNDDEIFGQLGNDVIQGDGSIDYNLACGGVGASRDLATNAVLQICPSTDNIGGAGTDGTDYVEGGGGNDVIFGNEGQDDLIGGSSNLFTLTTPAQRPDGTDLIFGGSGTTDIARNDAGDTAGTGHASDSDAVVGDDGDIVRVVGTNHLDQGGFRSFGYDNYSAAGAKIVPRAVVLLDYTAGGPDFNAAGAATDIGAADEIHGGRGDDFIYGMKGNDVLYGDAQNDTIIAGYGNDWISGGSGDDGILGDDGRLLVSRVGTAEPLYGIGIDAQQNLLISNQGNQQQAVINVTNALRYTADLTPDNLIPNDPSPTTAQETNNRPLFANDVIYGGWGNDSIHAGAGDDAISGAEAPAGPAYANVYNQNGSLSTAHVETDFTHPYNPGNLLGYSPVTTKLAQFDANDPLRKITLNADGSLNKTAAGGDNWFLNFATTEPGEPIDSYWVSGSSYDTPSGRKPTDGDDVIFGDLGHDWLVGGTGRDQLFAGWGDDMLNIDDNLTTNSSLTTTPDTNPSYEDLAFGGAGRDVFIGNTGGDRLIDWVGEFNTYLVPFAPFGMPTISDQLQPGLPEYLYALSKSDGADQTLIVQHGGAAARNGEPFGELGLIIRQDDAWDDQRGNPRDPQAGNIPGGPRDVLVTSGTHVLNSPATTVNASPFAAVFAPAAAPSTIALTYGASDVDGISSTGATLDSSQTISSGGAINVYTLTAGIRTLVVWSGDLLGNISSRRSTPSSRHSMRVAASFSALLVNWTQDLITRL